MPEFQINPSQQIAVMSRMVLEYRLFETPFVLISAYDSDIDPINLNSPYLHDALFLQFDDLHKYYPGYECFTAEQAQQVADFVLKYKSFPLIVCQCEAGVSRSSAMAAAIMWFLTGDDTRIFTSKFFYPNKHVYRLLVEEFVRRGCNFEPHFDQKVPYTEKVDLNNIF